MNAALTPGTWYRYHGQPALFTGKDVNQQYNFEINTAAGVISVRIGGRRLHKEITML